MSGPRMSGAPICMSGMGIACRPPFARVIEQLNLALFVLASAPLFWWHREGWRPADGVWPNEDRWVRTGIAAIIGTAEFVLALAGSGRFQQSDDDVTEPVIAKNS